MKENPPAGRVRRVFPYSAERYRGFVPVVHDRFLILEETENDLIFLYSSRVHMTEAAAIRYSAPDSKPIAAGTLDQGTRLLTFSWPEERDACEMILFAVADIAVLERLGAYSVQDAGGHHLGLLSDFWRPEP